MTTKMTPEQAKHFTSASPMNAAIVIDGLTCDCKPYEDVFTMKRWNAQGYKVKKGQHGIWLRTFTVKEETDDKGNIRVKRLPKMTLVFCRCQVEEFKK